MKLKTFMKNNFGDLPLNSYLFEKISGKKPKCAGLKNICYDPHLLISGSILSHSSSSSIIWGSGFMNSTDRLKVKPRRIYAVRGRLSWEILDKQGVKSPYIFGDPALLMPKFYAPKADKKYDLGIIPHYVDYDSTLLEKFRDWEPHVKIINVCSEVERFIDQVRACDCIVSSSLHGLIIADAYGIPSGWVKITDNVVGNGFKFRDYFTTRVNNSTSQLCITNDTNELDLSLHARINKTAIDLDRLQSCCPISRI